MCVSRRLASLLPLALAMTLSAGSVAAQQATDDRNLLDDSFVFQVGGFLLGSDTRVQLDGATQVGGTVDFDEDLDTGGDSLRARADFLWRISPKHHLRGMWFNDTRDGHGTLAEDVQWGDYTFGAGSEAEARTRFTVGEIAYEYAFYKRPRVEANVSLGLHWVGFDLEIEAEAIDETGASIGVVAESADASGPLPVLGLRGSWLLPHHWTIDLSGQWFFGSFGDYSGSIQDYRVGGTWMATRHVGLGLSYEIFIVDVDVSKQNADASLRWGYDGIRGYLAFAF